MLKWHEWASERQRTNTSVWMLESNSIHSHVSAPPQIISQPLFLSPSKRARSKAEKHSFSFFFPAGQICCLLTGSVCWIKHARLLHWSRGLKRKKCHKRHGWNMRCATSMCTHAKTGKCNPLFVTYGRMPLCSLCKESWQEQSVVELQHKTRRGMLDTVEQWLMQMHVFIIDCI